MALANLRSTASDIDESWRVTVLQAVFVGEPAESVTSRLVSSSYRKNAGRDTGVL
jgi:hypothetical protein